MHPKMLNKILGRKFKYDMNSGDRLLSSSIEKNN